MIGLNASDSLFVSGIAAGATLLAVIVTSTFNIMVARLNISAQSRSKSKELRIAKLEELFFLFDKWQLNFSQIYLLHLRCHRGKLTYREVEELVEKQTLLAPGEAQKYRMIMDLHFPSLTKEYALVEDARKRLVPFLSDPAVAKVTVTDFIERQVAFETASDAFKSKMSALARDTLK